MTMIGCLALSFLASSAKAQETNIDPALPSYAVVSGVSGNLNSIGSDALNNLMTGWIGGFKKLILTSIFTSKAEEAPLLSELS